MMGEYFMLNKAIEIAAKVHTGQLDKGPFAANQSFPYSITPSFLICFAKPLSASRSVSIFS